MVIIFYLHPYSNNLLKRLGKTPKQYFYDTGFVCYLTKWSSAEALASGTMNGAILENYVVAEIMKTYLNCDKWPYLYYYRDKAAKEIECQICGKSIERERMSDGHVFLNCKIKYKF